MQLSRGCGCLALILALFNLLMVASVILGLAQQKVSGMAPWAMFIAFGANLIVCVMIAVPAMRSKSAPQTGTQAEAGSNEAGEGEEGEDAD